MLVFSPVLRFESSFLSITQSAHHTHTHTLIIIIIMAGEEETETFAFQAEINQLLSLIINVRRRRRACFYAR
tara:strand:+ start:45 stop:260 length:216 start_codon:yes stop_codon:yes gene_type:complete